MAPGLRKGFYIYHCQIRHDIAIAIRIRISPQKPEQSSRV